MTTKIQLPLFKEDLLPTGKMHTSYSEIAVHAECSWRHKLVYIDKLDTFTGNEFTEYGHVLHSFSEPDFLGITSIPDGLQLSLFDTNQEKPAKNKLIEEAKSALREKLKVVNYEDKDNAWENGLGKLLESFPKWMDETFPGWKPVAVEFPLFERIEDQKKNRYFKGFLDRVIMAPKPPRKGSKPKPEGTPIEWEFWILDLKTTGWGWSLDQKTDPNKRMQLVLYKHYFCKKLGLDLKKVKCAFVLCKRAGGKKDDHFEKIDVSVGPLTIQNSLDTVNSMINSATKGLYTKNRNSCKWCVFKNTKNCP